MPGSLKDRLPAKRVERLVDEMLDSIYDRGIEPNALGFSEYRAHVAASALFVRGFHPKIEAGDCYWPRLKNPEGPDSRSVGGAYIGEGWKPELLETYTGKGFDEGFTIAHAWCVLTCDQTNARYIFDLEPSAFVRACTEHVKLPWLSRRPPRYIFRKKLPPGVSYEPIKEATRWVTEKLWKDFKPDYLVEGPHGCSRDSKTDSGSPQNSG